MNVNFFQINALLLLNILLTVGQLNVKCSPKSYRIMEENEKYIGMWVTKDGYIRQELLPNNRYDEARGDKKSAYQGRYKITGNHIDYWDDTGFTADGEFREGVLYHGGYVFYKEANK